MFTYNASDMIKRIPVVFKFIIDKLAININYRYFKITFISIVYLILFLESNTPTWFIFVTS